MPIYDLKCKECNSEYQVRASFEERQKAACPKCGSIKKGPVFKANIKGPVSSSSNNSGCPGASMSGGCPGAAGGFS